MQMLDTELNNVKRLYDEQMAIYIETGSMPIHKNMAPVSGSLKWSQELRDRITIPMNEFRRLEHPCVTSRHITPPFFVYLFNVPPTYVGRGIMKWWAVSVCPSVCLSRAST